MASLKNAAAVRAKIEDDRTYTDVKHYGAEFSPADDHGTSNNVVIAPNGDAIAVTTSINNVYATHYNTDSKNGEK